MEYPRDCRILVISPKADAAQRFVQCIQTLSGSKEISLRRPELSDTITPWTIVNKYYTADVHFDIRSFDEFKIKHADGVPAFVYIWEHGQPFKDHILDISHRLRDHDPEVSLAVKFGSGLPSDVAEEEGIDEFLSSHGFEYIEGDRTGRRSTPSQSDPEDIGIPGLPRVIDALSTIMWPSIVQSESTLARKSRARELLDWARGEEDEDGLRALISSESIASDLGASSSVTEGDHLGDIAVPTRKSRMQREMEELEKWLADEDSRRDLDEDQAWVTGPRVSIDDTSAWQDIPTPVVKTPTGEEEHTSLAMRFDDDFTEFVSAPSPRLLDADHLIPMHTGASYQSLASVSDFGAEGVVYASRDEHDELDSDDPDLPSRTEVLETSRRIFGSAGPLPNPDISMSSDDARSFERHDPDDDEFEPAAFDLSRVLSAIHGMKEEIRGMEDEGERRRAAARVALGLVYGLQADHVDD